MEKEFIPYEEALVLKELGFDEQCLGYYNDDQGEEDTVVFRKCNYKELYEYTTLAPLYQQAFRWLYKKSQLLSTNYSIEFTDGWDLIYFDNEEIEGMWRNDEALRKLIEIVKK